MRTTSWHWASQQSKVYFIPMKEFSSDFLINIPETAINEENLSRNQFINLRNTSLKRLEETSEELRIKFPLFKYTTKLADYNTVNKIKKLAFSRYEVPGVKYLAIKNVQHTLALKSPSPNRLVQEIKSLSNIKSITNEATQERRDESVKPTKNITFLRKAMKFAQRYQKSIQGKSKKSGSIWRKAPIIEHSQEQKTESEPISNKLS